MTAKNHLAVFGLLLSLGLIVSTYLVTDVIRDVRLSHQIIKVRGYAEKNVVSDLAVWEVSVTARAPSIVDGYAVIEAGQKEVIAFLKENSVSDSEVHMPSVVIEEKKKKKGYEETNETDHFLLTRRFEVTSSDVKKILSLSTQIDKMIAKGIEVRSQNPMFYYSKVNEIKDELLTEATKDARGRANTLAEGSGVKLGFLRAARQGDFSIRSAQATSISSGSSYDDVFSINKKITAVVTVDYAMK